MSEHFSTSPCSAISIGLRLLQCIHSVVQKDFIVKNVTYLGTSMVTEVSTITVS